MAFAYVCMHEKMVDGVTGEGFGYDGPVPWPLVNGMEIHRVLMGPPSSVTKLLAEPDLPEELRRTAIEWLARRGVDIKVVRAT
jgi:hypothetical protein